MVVTSADRIESLVEDMGLQTSLLRRLNDPKVIRADRKRLLETASPTVTTKARRITITAKYIELAARTGEAQASSASDPGVERRRSNTSLRYDRKAAHHASEMRYPKMTSRELLPLWPPGTRQKSGPTSGSGTETGPSWRSWSSADCAAVKPASFARRHRH